MGRTKKDENETLYHEALEFLDGLHVRVVEFGERLGIEPRDPLVSDDGKHWPATQFVVEGEDKPEPGGLAFDTRLSLCLTKDQADTLLFELSRAIRDLSDSEHDEFELKLDGRLMVRRAVVRDIQRAIDD